MQKHVFVKIPFFNGLHRFLPALFLGLEYEATFIKVNHRPREFGKSKYFDGLFIFSGYFAKTSTLSK